VALEEATVVRTRDLAICGLKGCRTAQRSGGGKKVGGSVDAVDVLVIGDVEGIGQQLQLIALFDGECLLGANIVNKMPGQSEITLLGALRTAVGRPGSLLTKHTPLEALDGFPRNAVTRSEAQRHEPLGLASYT